jgi:hypothetical protein
MVFDQDHRRWFRPLIDLLMNFVVTGKLVAAKILKRKQLKGLILAQNERWRRGLGMQVEREFPQGNSSGERESNT